MALTVRKKVTFEFLGDEYRECYLYFRAIPVKDYTDIQQRLADLQGVDSIAALIDVLKAYFLSGQFTDEKGELVDVTADDIGNLDKDSIVLCFQRFTGQDDPKEILPSPTPLPTDNGISA